MANDKSTTHRDAVLNVMRGTTLTSFTPYVSLHDGDPGATGANEITGSAYVRKAATFGAPEAGATGRMVQNSAAVQWTSLDSGSSKTITYGGIWDAETSGNFRYRIPLSASKVVNAGDPCEFAIGDLDVEET